MLIELRRRVRLNTESRSIGIIGYVSGLHEMFALKSNYLVKITKNIVVVNKIKCLVSPIYDLINPGLSGSTFRVPV